MKNKGRVIWLCLCSLFLSVIINSKINSLLQSSRCNPHRMQVLLLRFQRLVWLPSSLIPLFETDTYDQLSLWLMPLWSVSSDPTLSWKNPAIFRCGSVDYGPKSICGREWNLFEIMQDRNKGFWSINRNRQSFGYSALIRDGSACLFLRQTRVHDAILLPEVVIPENYPYIQASKG